MARKESPYGFEPAEPEKRRRAKSSGLEALLLLALLAIVLVLAVPSWRKQVGSIFTVTTQQQIDNGVTVWANQGTGTYSCTGSRFYGHGEGRYMKQGDALTQGYQPELSRYCAGGQPADSQAVAERSGSASKHTGSSSTAESAPYKGAPARRR